jgi:hypothetical protein
MSDFAYNRFLSHNMLTGEEVAHKDEIIEITEHVLDAKGLQCDASIAKVSNEQLKEILEKVRELRKKRKRVLDRKKVLTEHEEYADNNGQKEQLEVIE